MFGNSAEGSSTLAAQVRVLGLEELIFQSKVLLISGGDLDERYPYFLHDHFLVRILDYKENIQEMQRFPEIFAAKHQPYRFLFLNGRARPHRKYLWERFRMAGLLDSAIWTMLDGRMAGSRLLRVQENGKDLMDTNTPIKHLPHKYEVNRYAGKRKVDTTYPHQYVKNDLFNNEWGEIYLKADMYIDSYFSVVTETVLEYPHSFRTEKIAKVLAMGHPWICASNSGFYRDMQQMGFKTFAGVIDEGFDEIDNDQDRLDRITTVVQDICDSDLPSFLAACEPICKYNQQHLQEVSQQIRSSFPASFFNFIQRQRP